MCNLIKLIHTQIRKRKKLLALAVEHKLFLVSISIISYGIMDGVLGGALRNPFHPISTHPLLLHNSTRFLSLSLSYLFIYILSPFPIYYY